MQLGQVGGLGKGEQIHAVRFLGDTGYVVTFRQVDPLYTLDLSDPAKPRAVGELKIRGYSAYLHPLEPGLLLGVGQDASERGATLGTQVSLFDVSDPARPSRLHQWTVPGGSSSEAEWDHHAFLWWAPSKLAVLPVESWQRRASFAGAVGLSVDRSGGIAEAGRVESRARRGAVARAPLARRGRPARDRLGRRDRAEQPHEPGRGGLARVPLTAPGYPGHMLQVARHESDELSWEMVTRSAAAPLRAHVREYTGYVERTARPLVRREVPSGDVHLIISPDTKLRLPDVRDASRPAATHGSFVAALHDTYALVEHDGYQHGVEVRLTPLGAHALFGQSMSELTNRVVELDDLLGRGADELVGRLWDAAGWEARFDLLDRLIAARVADARPPSEGVAWAWRRLRETRGRAAVGGLAAELGWSHRRLIARFREQVGMPPKTIGRVLRFENVSRALMGTPEPRLAEVAFDCGYYDQAHLNRDFREFAGTTPGAYVAARLPEGGGVSG